MDRFTIIIFGVLIFNASLVLFAVVLVRRSRRGQFEQTSKRQKQILEQGKIISAQERLLKNKEELLSEKDELISRYRQEGDL